MFPYVACGGKGFALLQAATLCATEGVCGALGSQGWGCCAGQAALAAGTPEML